MAELVQFQWSSPCSWRNGPKTSQPASTEIIWSPNQTEVSNEYLHTEEGFNQKDETLKQIPNRAWRTSNERGCKLGSRRKIPLNSRDQQAKQWAQWAQFWVPYLFYSPALGPLGCLVLSLYGTSKCWPKTNRLPDISPAKMGLSEISRELQFRVCNHGETQESPTQQRKENAFIEVEIKLGGL